MNKGNCCVGEEDIVVYKISTSWLSFLICVGPVKHMHMYMHTCAVYHFDCHFIAVTTVNSIVYTQHCIYTDGQCTCTCVVVQRTCAHTHAAKHMLFCTREHHVNHGNVIRKVLGRGR